MLLSNLIDAYGVFTDQLAHPEGAFGDVISDYMNASFNNVNHWALQLMAVQADENILELGFGAGHCIQRLVSDTPANHIVGLDNSALMVAKATALNQVAIQQGRVSLVEGDVRQLPHFDHMFSKVVAINTTMYWPYRQMPGILKNIRNTLVPGGSFYIIYQRPIERFVQGGCHPEFKEYFKLLQKAGFIDLKAKAQNTELLEPDVKTVGLAVIGTNPIFAK
ncbi:MAG: UbiE/COQ5 methyltransferase [Vampirovibrio sp.]|jgi:cyclopropane fatty-acyl-phospholipid synthase-like methyltransferase|nr:UbiE/COQ5 methyltransferase [Vampirovibrio sp.]